MQYVRIAEKEWSNWKVVPITEVSIKPRPYEAHVSTYNFDKRVLDYIKLNADENGKPSMSGYSGSVGLNYLWFDIDYKEATQVENIGASQVRLKQLLNRLVNDFKVFPNQISIYFSGRKGFHVGLNQKLFGGFFASELLPRKIKVLAEFMTDGIKNMDMGIYTRVHNLRMPNSLNTGSGLYKIPLTFDEAISMKPEEIIDLAKAPRSIDGDWNKIQAPNKELLKLWEYASQKLASEEAIYISNLEQITQEVERRQIDLTEGMGDDYENWVKIAFAINEEEGEEGRDIFHRISRFHSKYNFKDADRKYSAVIKSPLPMGERVTMGTLVHLARQAGIEVQTKVKKVVNLAGLQQTIGEIFKRSTLSKDQVAYISQSINKAEGIGASSKRVSQLVGLAAEKYRVETKKISVKTVSDCLPEYIEYKKSEKNPFVIDIPSIDEHVKGKFRGKVTYIIGVAGTKKSLLVHGIAIANAKMGIRGAYSNMEMSNNILLDRSFNQVLEFEDEQASDHIERKMNQDPEFMTDFLMNKVGVAFKDFFLIIDSTDMTPEDFDEAIEHILAEYGEIEYLAIDGISMMGGKGNDIEINSKNSKGLRQTAIKYGIAIFGICHVPNNIPLDQRDLFSNIRGSGKIKDNGDMFISLSRIQDKSGDQHIKVWEKDLIYMRFFDKSGKSTQIDKILKLDSKSLIIRETNQDPSIHNQPSNDFEF